MKHIPETGMPRHPQLALVIVLLLLAVPSSRIPDVSAQSTPAAQRYGNQDQGYAAQFTEVLIQLDAFWSAIFESSGMDYRTPEVVPLNQPIATGCGPIGPQDFAMYCSVDEAIYYSAAAFTEHAQNIGDFSPIVVIAHEWGHHVQRLVGLVKGPGTAFELQADCLAGAYASDAGQQGLLDPGDLTEAVATSSVHADPLGLPQDAPPGTHGNSDDRLTSFMRGYLDGVTGCDLPLSTAQQPPAQRPAGPPVPNPGSAPQTVGVAPPNLSALVPTALELPHGRLRLFDEGAATIETLATGFPDPVEATRLLQEWGWSGNLYRYFVSDNPPPNGAGWVELSIHRFASADAAAAALPYFATGRMAELGLTQREIGLFGDQTEAVGGQAYNGTELTIYARRGNLLIRATAIAPVGDPRADVTEVALYPLRQLIDHVGVVAPAMLDLLPTTAMLPPGLQPAGDHARSAATNADTFADPDEAGELFQAWGWREQVARSFVAVGSGTANGTTQFDAAIYRFADPRGASQALPYFLEARARALNLHDVAGPHVGDEARAIGGPVEGGQEATLYVRVGDILLRLTAVGPGNPMADIEALVGASGYSL